MQYIDNNKPNKDPHTKTSIPQQKQTYEYKKGNRKHQQTRYV